MDGRRTIIDERRRENGSVEGGNGGSNGREKQRKWGVCKDGLQERGEGLEECMHKRPHTT